MSDLLAVSDFPAAETLVGSCIDSSRIIVLNRQDARADVYLVLLARCSVVEVQAARA